MEPSHKLHISNTLDSSQIQNFFIKYHNINNKLKKRFMRNPNVADASNQFIALAAECEHEETWHYAAMCYLAASQCYHTLGNTESEINYLSKAARHFLSINKQNTNIGCPSIGQADLQAASNCFNEITKCCENKSRYNAMSAAFTAELANALGPTPAGEQLMRKAISIYPTVEFINTLMSYCLKQDNHVAALNIGNDLINLIETIGTPSEYYRDLLHKTEVNRLMLTLMIQHTSQRSILPSSDIIEKYISATDDFIIDANIDEDEFLALQSLVLACQSHDNQALLEIEAELWKYMDINQKDFLRTLIRIVIDE